MPDISPAIFWTGLLLGIVAIFTSFFRNIPKYIFSYVRRLFIVRVEVLNSDILFEWLKIWFDKDNYTKKSKMVTANAVSVNEVNFSNTFSKRWRVQFTPSPGYHIIFFKGKPVLVNRDRRDIAASTGNVVGMRDAFILYFFSRKQSVIREFLREAELIAHEEKINKLTIFSADFYQNWSVLAHREKRPLESVILDKGVKEAIFRDINDFLDAEQWYSKMSIPFHRGYLFHGPPGSGKSSLAIALASELNLDMYLLNLNNLNDARLTSLLSTLPSHSIVLLEDVDSAFSNREALSHVTFSGFLNALDGIYAKDGIIVFMSTNHIERLDAALLRPGRVDCKVFLGHSSQYQQEQAFLRFFPEKYAEASKFVYGLREKEVSMAAIQEYLLLRRLNLQGALNELDTITTLSYDILGQTDSDIHLMPGRN